MRRTPHVVRWLMPEWRLGNGAEHHFVRDYRRLVTKMLVRHSVDDAMAAAVGGGFEHYGLIEYAMLRAAGLEENLFLVDFGCGSGRLAHALGRQKLQLRYLGIDVDARLLDYARKKSPSTFRFIESHGFGIPAEDATADMICAFSVFTHLRHNETYLYLEDMRRILRPGGKLVFSFLEFAESLHWQIFMETVDCSRQGRHGHLNQFIDRHTIELWCHKLGYVIERFIATDEVPPGATSGLGQSAVILSRAV